MRRDLAVERLEESMPDGVVERDRQKRQRGTIRIAARTARAPVRIVSSARTKWVVEEVARSIDRARVPACETTA
jgi:hypothetical protein